MATHAKLNVTGTKNGPMEAVRIQKSNQKPSFLGEC
jgi:hypothetical protein